MSVNDGGPAFPLRGDATDENMASRNIGLSLRDYFAAHCPLPLNENVSYKDEAKFRYEYADAMLKERDRDRRPSQAAGSDADSALR